MKRQSIALLGALLFSLSASAQNLVVTNAKVEVGNGTTLESANIVITNGKIMAVAKDAKAPKGHAIIDAAGHVVTPGLVETQAQVGLSDIMFDAAESDHSFRGQNITPAFRAAEGYNPSSNWVAIQREEGVTSVVLTPLGGMISGSASWVSLSGSLDEMPNREPSAMSGNLDGSGRDTYGKSRGGMWMKVREIFDDARFYQKNKSAYQRGQTRKLVLSATQLEAMSPVISKKIPLVLEVHRASDILQTLAFAKEQNIRVILRGASEGWRVAKAIKDAKVPVLVQPSIQAPFGFQAMFARDDLATLLSAAGVEVIVSAGLDWDQNIRRLRQQAGIAVANGLDYQKALSAITQTPAKVFGLNDVGTLERGKRGDLVIWTGDPLELSTMAKAVVIGGREFDTTNRQRQLAEKYLEKKMIGVK